MIWLLTILPLCLAANLCDYRVFNWNYYLNFNKDLLQKGIKNRIAACDHWRIYGADEGRQAHPKLSVKLYCKKYSDIRNMGYCKIGSYSKAVNHYLTIGIKDERQGIYRVADTSNYYATRGKLTVSASDIYGFSVFSIMYNDQTEIVNAYDHGRELQYTMNFTNTPFRVNQAGSESDGIYNSSSTRLSVVGYERYMEAFFSVAKPAIWKGKGYSQYSVQPEIIVENQHRFVHIIIFNEVYMFQKLTMEIPSLSMVSQFNTVYEFDPVTRTYKKIDLPKPGEFTYSTKPLIFENGENVAIGMRFQAIEGIKNYNITYSYYGRFGSIDPIDQSTKMCTILESTDISTQLKFKAYTLFAVGNITEVARELGK